MQFLEGLIRRELNRKWLLFLFKVLSFWEVIWKPFWDEISLIHDRQSRKKFGLLEKHKDYVVRAKAYHKKEETIRVTFLLPQLCFNSCIVIRLHFYLIVRYCPCLCMAVLCSVWLQRLKEKAAFRNPDEFYLKMIKTKIVDGVHRLE